MCVICASMCLCVFLWCVLLRNKKNMHFAEIKKATCMHCQVLQGPIPQATNSGLFSGLINILIFLLQGPVLIKGAPKYLLIILRYLILILELEYTDGGVEMRSSLSLLLRQVQVNFDMTDSMGPEKLVRHMQNLSYTYDKYLIRTGVGPSMLSVICKNLSYSDPSYPSSPAPFY